MTLPAHANGNDAITARGGLLELIHELAKNKDFDAAKFALLLDRHEALLKEHQRQIAEIDFVKMQGKIEAIKRSGKNPTFNSFYSKLEDLDEAARPAYIECGFGIHYGWVDSPKGKDWIRAEITVAHIGGWYKDTYLDLPIDYQQGNRARTPLQAVGSSVTYGQKYLLRGALNLIAKNNPDDDDGEATRVDEPPQKPSGPLWEEAEKAAKEGGENAVRNLWKKSSVDGRRQINSWLSEHLEPLYP